MPSFPVTVPTGRRWCVYTHAYRGKIFYVGKGLANRPFEQNLRHPNWKAFVEKLPSYDVTIVFWTDDEQEAKEEERRLVSLYWPACNTYFRTSYDHHGKPYKLRIVTAF